MLLVFAGLSRCAAVRTGAEAQATSQALAERAYRVTLPTNEILLGDDVMAIMAAMSASYSERLGVEAAAVANGHQATVEAMFKARAAGDREA